MSSTTTSTSEKGRREEEELPEPNEHVAELRECRLLQCRRGRQRFKCMYHVTVMSVIRDDERLCDDELPLGTNGATVKCAQSRWVSARKRFSFYLI